MLDMVFVCWLASLPHSLDGYEGDGNHDEQDDCGDDDDDDDIVQ